MKVLLVEDDAETHAYVKRGLEQHGHGVDAAATGREGLFLALGDSYDVIILDRMLPELDGLAVIKALRSAA